MAAPTSTTGTKTATALHHYRGLNLGSAWSALSSTEDGSPAALRSRELLKRAHGASVGTTWLKEVQRLPSASFDSDPVDEQGVEGVLKLLKGRFASRTKFERDSAEMLAGLNQQSATKYELGLKALGDLLGAESFKPPGKGRADVAWMWDALWLTVEAKSEQEPEGMLSMDYVRQTNTQLSSLAADRGEDDGPPEGSASAIVTPRSVVDPDAVPIAQPHVHLAAPRLMLDLAHDSVRAWKELRAAGKGVPDEVFRHQVAQTMWEHRVLPTQVRERLTRDPIRGA